MRPLDFFSCPFAKRSLLPPVTQYLQSVPVWQFLRVHTPQAKCPRGSPRRSSAPTQRFSLGFKAHRDATKMERLSEKGSLSPAAG